MRLVFRRPIRVCKGAKASKNKRNVVSQGRVGRPSERGVGKRWADRARERARALPSGAPVCWMMHEGLYDSRQCFRR